MGRHEANPPQALYLLDLLQKLCKGNGILQILTVRINVLPKQHHFHYAIRHQMLNFLYDFFRITAPFPPPHIWHDTVAAEIIASEHNIDSGFVRIFAVYWQLFHDLIGLLPDIDNHFMILEHGHQKLRELKNIVGTEDQIHEAVALCDLLDHRLFLHHTAAESNFKMGLISFHAV